MPQVVEDGDEEEEEEDWRAVRKRDVVIRHRVEGDPKPKHSRAYPVTHNQNSESED